MRLAPDSSDVNLSRRAFGGTFGAATLASLVLGGSDDAFAFTPCKYFMIR